MYNCEHCNTAVTETYGSGRFCNSKCARSFATAGSPKDESKLKPCNSCGTPTLVNKRTSGAKVKCDMCVQAEFQNLPVITKNKIETPKNNTASKIYKPTVKICKFCATKFIGNRGVIKCNSPQCKSHQIVPTLVKYFSFDETAIGTERYPEEFEKAKLLIESEYFTNGLSAIEITNKYKCGDSRNFSKILKSLDITPRTPAEATNNFINSDRYDAATFGGNGISFKNGEHITFDGKTIFYRSSYELAFAKELDAEEIPYEFETLKIGYWDSQHSKHRIAIPDFYIPEANMIVEIKSTWTLDVQNMIDRYRAYTNGGYAFMLMLNQKEVAIEDLLSGKIQTDSRTIGNL